MAPPVWVVGQVLAAADVNSWFIPLAAVKTADQSVVSSTALVNDTELFLTIPSAGTYVFHLMLDYDGAATGTGDIKWNFTSPGNVRYTYCNFGPGGSASAGNLGTGAGVFTGGTAGAGNLKGVLMLGTLVCLASGTLQFQWAQNTSSGTATVVHAQSCLIAQRVS